MRRICDDLNLWPVRLQFPGESLWTVWGCGSGEVDTFPMVDHHVAAVDDPGKFAMLDAAAIRDPARLRTLTGTMTGDPARVPGVTNVRLAWAMGAITFTDVDDLTTGDRDDLSHSLNMLWDLANAVEDERAVSALRPSGVLGSVSDTLVAPLLRRVASLEIDLAVLARPELRQRTMSVLIRRMWAQIRVFG